MSERYYVVLEGNYVNARRELNQVGQSAKLDYSGKFLLLETGNGYDPSKIPGAKEIHEDNLDHLLLQMPTAVRGIVQSRVQGMRPQIQTSENHWDHPQEIEPSGLLRRMQDK